MASATTIRQNLALPMPPAPRMNSPAHNKNTINMMLSTSRCGIPAQQLTPSTGGPTQRLPSLRGILERMHFESSSLKRPRSLGRDPMGLSPVIPCATVQRRHSYTSQAFRANTNPRVGPSATLSRRPILSTPTSFSHDTSTATSSSTTVTPTLPQQKIASRKRSWNCMAAPKKKASFAATTTPVNRPRASKFCKVEGCQRVSQRNNLCHSHGGKRLCREAGCNSKDRGNGFCIKHGGGKICSEAKCEKKARRKGLCTQHFRVLDISNAPTF